MVICFQTGLSEALQEIEFKKDYHEFIIQSQEEKNSDNYNDDNHKDNRLKDNYKEFIGFYGAVKWQILKLLNQKYNTSFDLLNWLHHEEGDEVAYFLNEAGSNTLNYSEFKMPSRFHLWKGKKGFVIGIEQNGKGFNAQEINMNKIKENEGAAFNFFRKCKSIIFFDNGYETRIVYLRYLF